MTRYVSATNQTAGEQPSVVMAVLVSLDFTSGELNVHDGVGTITDTLSSPNRAYLGVGQFGGIDGSVQDSLEVIARPIKLTLTGVDSSVINSAMTEDYQGRDVLISLGYIQNGSLIAAPEVLWEGRMDYLEVEMGMESGTVRVNCESRLRREPRIARYTSEDQKLAYPTDKFFDLVPYIQGFKSQWGNRTTTLTSEPSRWQERHDDFLGV